MDKVLNTGQLFFAVSMVALGVQHFIYVDFVVGVVPSPLPEQLFFLTYVTGTILIAAGLSIILKIRARMVVAMLGVMLFLFFLILHVPKVTVDPLNGQELTNALKTLAICGGALVMAGTLSREN